MDITAAGGNFYVGVARSDIEYRWNKNGTLSFWGESDLPVHISTRLGDFIECTDAAGNVLMDGGDGEWYFIEVGKEEKRLRFKELPDPKLSKAALDKARQTVTRYLLHERPYDLPRTLNGMIGWMQKQMARIPRSARAKASFEFDTETEYGETYPYVEITYEEQETDAEVIRRIQIETERARILDVKKRAELARLKAELEPTP